jgi:hypothetical protein
MKDLNGIEYNLYDFISYALKKKVVIFGAGKYGNYIYEVLNGNGINIVAVCDNNKDKLYSLRDKYPVRTLEDLKSTLEEYYFIIAIAKIDIIKAIRNQLNDFGVKSNKLVIPLPDSNSNYFDGLIMFEPEYCIQAIKEHWVRVRQDSKQIVDYFETNELYELIVYEIDEFKGWLEQDLLNSRVVIKKRIKALEEFTDREECDAVVVLDEVNYEVIEEELMSRTEAPIISIWDIVRL